MRVVLVNPPKTERERDEIAPPLGLLRLAQIARLTGVSVAVEDYNLLYHLDSRLREDFFGAAVERLNTLDADIYGFTSMAVDSHVALELARRLKLSNAKRTVIFGGPHFSSLGDGLQRRYMWVDHVVRGEGEQRFGELLQRLTRRTQLNVISANSDASPPQPAYSLVQLPAYFYVNPQHLFDFEVNRGCRYKCTFCYSPNFYGKARNFGVDETVEQLNQLCSLGGKRVFFVGDNFLNDRAWAAHFCEALAESRLPLDWYCYVTLPDLTNDLVKIMGQAGCSQIFMGVDVVGQTSERHFHKAFLRRETDLEQRIRAIRDGGIEHPTCGFILCPPSHPGSVDWFTTVGAALKARRAGASVLFNVLNLYPGTNAYAEEQRTAEFDSIQSKLLMDVPPVVQENSYAVADPALFPFHSRYVAAEEWHGFVRMAHCLHTLVNSFPEHLTEIWQQSRTSPFEFAKRVLERTGDLLHLEVDKRRISEQNEALAEFQRFGETGPENVAQLTDRLCASGQGFW